MPGFLGRLAARHLTARPQLLFRAPGRIPRRRVQTDSAPSGGAAAAAEGGAEVGAAAKRGPLAKLWHSPVGPKTVHFWAPIMKWGLVLTGVSDFWRPAEALSLTQNLALLATGAIWTRWCFIIKPRNLFLAAVNFFLGIVGSIQVGRIVLYRRGLKGGENGDGEGVGKIVDEAEQGAKVGIEKSQGK